MKLANIGGRASIVIDGRALDVERASDGKLGSGIEVLTDLTLHDELRALAADADAGALTTFDDASMGPVSRSGKGIGIALNYRGHAEESGLAIPEAPTAFGKFSSSYVGPYADIHVPESLNRVDFEAEVVVAIGSRLRNVEESQVWASIAGVTAGQDVTDRREQWRKPLNQFTVSKSYDTFSPCGPVLATVDEFDDPDDIEISGHVDDLEVQHGRTSDLIFSVPVLVSWLSRFVTLEPGDLIFTGTPAGCGVTRNPRLYLQPGMMLTTEIPQVGTMRNPITAG